MAAFSCRAAALFLPRFVKTRPGITLYVIPVKHAGKP